MFDLFMTFFLGLTVMEQIFFVCAIVGGLGFLFQVIALALGADVDGVDVDADIDVDAHTHGAGFQFISIQSLTAFFMMFGLVGFGLQREDMANELWSIVWATAAGLIALVTVSMLFTVFKRMQSSGTITLDNAIGEEGTVYLTIPPSGTGQVKVTVNGSLKIYDASSSGDNEIKTDEAIKVVAVKAGSLVVEKL